MTFKGNCRKNPSYKEKNLMTQDNDPFDNWQEDQPSIEAEDTLVVRMDGFEGPLDLLLALSRAKKIDLTALSIAELAGQYIDYIENLKKHRLEIAADYLVMAAWLTFLKSKLLLPSPEDDEEGPSGDELAAMLAFRLKRLDAMRKASKTLMERPQLGQDFYPCGAPAGFTIVTKHRYKPDFYGLLKAYASARQKDLTSNYKVKKREVWSIKRARERLQSLLGFSIEWAPIQDLIVQFLGNEDMKKTTVASTFGASLEMARDGVIELRQEDHFKPLYVKVRDAASEKNAKESEHD